MQLTTTGSAAELLLESTTKDNADHAGLSQPLKPLSHTGLLLETHSLDSQWNKSSAATLTDKTKDATEDSPAVLTLTSNKLEVLNPTTITPTLLNLERLELAISTQLMLFALSLDTQASMEKLDCTLKPHLPLEVPFQSVLMPQAGKTITVVS